MTTVFIGIGSNIHPEENMESAARLLRDAFPDIRFSSVYRTAPRELTDQPEFLNAVARFETEKDPDDIMAVLHVIEQTLKKAVKERFGPRTIDLDLLLYGEQSIEEGSLIIPHPRMHERRFVLEPLCELLDDKGEWEEYRQKTLDQVCERIEISL